MKNIDFSFFDEMLDYKKRKYNNSSTNRKSVTTLKPKYPSKEIETLYLDNDDNTSISTNDNSVKGNKAEKVVYYYQKDYSQPYGDGTIIDSKTGEVATIAEYGCALASIAMVASTMLNKKITPIDVNKILTDIGGCTANGTDTAKILDVLKKYNLNAKRVSDTESAFKSLDNGALIIVSLGPGTFTVDGHYLVLSKGNSKDTVTVYDPYDLNKCTEWNYDIICNEMFLNDSMWVIEK